MDESKKNVLYIVVILFLSIILYRDYTYVVPYTINFFENPFGRADGTNSLSWFLMLILGLVLSMPLFYTKWIGIVGLLFLTAVILKPVLIDKMRKQTAKEYLMENQASLRKIIERKDKGESISQEELTELGFIQFEKIEDTYIYAIQLLNGNGFGLCYDKNDTLPKSLFGETSFYERIEPNWYEFTVR